jgi:hypothetical protein
MAIVASDSGGGGEYKLVPQGTHQAVCNTVVDLGKQNTEFQGQGKVQHKVYIRWELPTERLTWTDRDGVEREGPMSIGKTYTLSLHEKAALRGDLEAWRGRAFTADELKGFDVAALLGKACQLTVVHAERAGKVYANVQSLAGWPKGLNRPEKTEQPLLIYDGDHPSAYDDLPEWLRTKVDAQVKDAPKPQNTGGFDDLDDDVPF